MSLRGIALLVFFIGSLPVCFVRPFYGLFLWTIVAFANPQAYTWGAATSFPWAMAVAIPTLVGMLLFCSGWRRLASREALLVIAMWIWFSVTTVISTHTPLFMHHAGDTWYRWETVSKILLMTLAAVVIVKDFHQLHVFLRVVALCFGVFVAKAFPFLVATGGQFRVYGPPNSMIADNNDFGLALNMTLPLFFFLAQVEEKRWLRWLFWALFVMTIPTIFTTYSRGALVGLLAVMGLMFMKVKQRWALVPVIALGLVVALMFAPESWLERMNPTREGAVDQSALSRINAWTFSWNLAQDYPLTGGGFATFTVPLFVQYAPVARDIHGAHSVYFQILGEHGFVGLFLYLALVASSIVSVHGLTRRARENLDPELANYANMILFGMVGFLTSGFFLGRAYFDFYFTLVASLIVLRDVAVREPLPDAYDDEEAGEGAAIAGQTFEQAEPA